MIRSRLKYAAAMAGAAAIGVGGVAPTVAARSHSSAQAVAATSCSGRWGRIDGQRKCLRAGEFCDHSDDREYRRYGFRCTRYYRNVHRYRLTYA